MAVIMILMFQEIATGIKQRVSLENQIYYIMSMMRYLDPRSRIQRVLFLGVFNFIQTVVRLIGIMIIFFSANTHLQNPLLASPKNTHVITGL